LPRKRVIDPGIWTSEDFAGLTIRQQLLFIGLISLADDDGRGRASSMTLKMSIFPLHDVTPQTIGRDLGALVKQGLCVVYTTNQHRYYELTGWSRHQRISHPARSTIPEPPNKTKELGVNPPEPSGALRNPPEPSPQEERRGEERRGVQPPYPPQVGAQDSPDPNKRAERTSPRQTGTNPRALGTNPRGRKTTTSSGEVGEASDQDTPTLQARRTGFNAALTGNPREANPHTPESEEWKCWRNGWIEGTQLSSGAKGMP